MSNSSNTTRKYSNLVKLLWTFSWPLCFCKIPLTSPHLLFKVIHIPLKKFFSHFEYDYKTSQSVAIFIYKQVRVGRPHLMVFKYLRKDQCLVGCLLHPFQNWDIFSRWHFILCSQKKWRKPLFEEKVIRTGEEISHSKYDDMQRSCRETV